MPTEPYPSQTGIVVHAVLPDMAYKLSFWIVLFLLFFNGGAVLLEESGTLAYMGLDAPQRDYSDEKAAVQEFDVGAGFAPTLFGLYYTLSIPLEALFDIIFPAEDVLVAAGIPPYLAKFFFGGLAIIPGYDIVRFLRGV